MSKSGGEVIAATPAKQSSEQGGSGQGDAPPPPYSEPSALPHQTQLPPQTLQIQYPSPDQLESSPLTRADGWIPPPSLAVARSRAIRRFWMAFFWAWLVWICIGMVIGGGVSDVGSNPVGRHGHWDKNGRWRED
ncbi:MAG: hypothetical protein TREMPRED_003355 [Tremellales sp. Tagirdzhanova-0007]|nr:MAG: hypothetical protein TREMPRED_003355 [Tremellales sp. Tagirdzhanova-0007]